MAFVMRKVVSKHLFFIDESGSLSNSSSVFILGCLKTDTPDSLEKKLNGMIEYISDNIYYDDFRETILTRGFHAAEDHPDVRAEIFKVLPLLNFRAYFVVIQTSARRLLKNWSLAGK